MIYAMHGVVEGANSELFSHRNLLDQDAFVRHLKSRATPYRAISDALDGSSDALTIDDATVAGANAASLARDLGHDVALFINGYNVEASVPYFFSRLNVALDECRATSAVFANHEYDVSGITGRRLFRQAVKRYLSTIGSEVDRQSIVTAATESLGSAVTPLPKFLRTTDIEQVAQLRTAGVAIENHGWTHSRLGCLSLPGHEEDIRRGRAWIKDRFQHEALYYAVPNGNGLSPWDESPHFQVWFLLDNRVPPGALSRNVFSRVELVLQ